MFRHPLLSAVDYEQLYSDGSGEVWEADGERQDFRLISERVAEINATADVLDLGCYTGHLLTSLPGGCALHGVELNREAASIAAGRGVQVIARRFEDLAGIGRAFDIIIACDVIEHVTDPLAFLAQVRTHLRANGHLILTTGDADAWLWRLSGARYWYCAFPEHISFIGRAWLRSLPARVGLRVAHLRTFNYRHARFNVSALRTLASASAYACMPRLYRYLRGVIREGTATDTPPGCGATRDHVLCVLSPV